MLSRGALVDTKVYVKKLIIQCFRTDCGLATDFAQVWLPLKARK